MPSKPFDFYFPHSRELLGNPDRYEEKVVPRKFSRSEKQFRHLFSDVFFHHVTPGLLGNPVNPKPALEGASRIFQRDDISALFRATYTSDFCISATPNSSIEDITDNIVDFPDFAELASAPPLRPGQSKPGSNHLCFVTGSVGQGKSLLLLKLVEVASKRQKQGELRSFPVCVDLEIAWGHTDGEFLNIGADFFAMLYDRIWIALDNCGDIQKSVFQVAQKSLPETADPVAKLQRLARWLPSQGYYLLLVLDNLDRFHFATTRYSFFESYNAIQLKSIEANMLRLVRDFQDENTLGALSATVILVCRHTVFRHIEQCRDASEVQGKSLLEYPVYQVFDASPETILHKRIDLLAHLVEVVRNSAKAGLVEPSGEAIAQKFKHAVDILKRSVDALRPLDGDQEGPPLRTLRYLHDLSHQGMRSFLDFIARLELDSRDDCEVVERLLAKKTTNLLRLYVTNLRKRYRQGVGHFPNLYLNDNKIAQTDGNQAAHTAPQKQTYWLKFVILKLIQTAPGGRMTFGLLFAACKGLGV